MKKRGTPPYISIESTDCAPFSTSTPTVEEIIEKWYDRLEFPSEYDEAFNRALGRTKISEDTKCEDYDKASEDGERNLLSFLYMCEATEKEYKKRGMSEKVLIETLKDIVVYTRLWTEVKGYLYLGELGWLKRHLSVNLFRLGRLQFAMGAMRIDAPEYGLKAGDPILEIHIPEGSPMTPEACDESFAMARKFFAEYFPDYHYKAFTCGSWLLDDTLKDHLKATSNILAFADRFSKITSSESFGLLRYLFKWNTTPESLPSEHAATSFAQSIKDAVLSGKKFYSTFGVIPV